MYYCINNILEKRFHIDILKHYYFSYVKDNIILPIHETQISEKNIVVCVRSTGLISGSKYKTKLMSY